MYIYHVFVYRIAGLDITRVKRKKTVVPCAALHADALIRLSAYMARLSLMNQALWYRPMTLARDPTQPAWVTPAIRTVSEPTHNELAWSRTNSKCKGQSLPPSCIVVLSRVKNSPVNTDYHFTCNEWDMFGRGLFNFIVTKDEMQLV